MQGFTIGTYQWALSSFLQGVAALSAIAGIFVVFVLQDRVSRRDDFWRDFKEAYTRMRSNLASWGARTIGDRKLQDIVVSALRKESDALAGFVEGSTSDNFDLEVGTAWNRYSVARRASSFVSQAYNDSHVDALPPVLVKLETVRRRADDFEKALRAMKRELIGPGILSGVTMLFAGISLAISDIVFRCASPDASGALMWTSVALTAATVIWTGISVSRLLTKWDQ